MDSRSAASAEQATPVTWQVFASKHWGANWVLGRKTEKSIKRLSKWDSASQTYKPPRFVSKDEYNHVRERWWTEVYKAQCVEIQRLNDLLAISATAPLLETIEELKAMIEDKDTEIAGLEDDKAYVERERDRFSEKLENLETEKLDEIPFVLSALYQGKPQEAIILLERIK